MGLFGGLGGGGGSGGGGGGGFGGFGGGGGSGGGGFGGFGGGMLPFMDPFMLINMLMGDPLGILGGDDDAGAETTEPAPSTDPLSGNTTGLGAAGGGDTQFLQELIQTLIAQQGAGGRAPGQQNRPRNQNSPRRQAGA